MSTGGHNKVLEVAVHKLHEGGREEEDRGGGEWGGSEEQEDTYVKPSERIKKSSDAFANDS